MNTKQFLIFITILGLSNFRCTKDVVTDPNGTIIKLPTLWSSATTDGALATSGLVSSTIFYNNSMLVGGRQNGSDALMLLDINSGTRKWVWQDFPIPGAYSYISYPEINESNMICQSYYFNINVDLQTGKTVWKNKFIKYGFSRYNSFFNGTIYCGSDGVNNYNYNPVGIFALNKQTGTPEFILPVKIDSSNALKNTGYSGEASFVYPFVNNQDTLISIIVFDPPITGYKARLTTCLYNKTKGVWIYERMPLFDASDSGVNGKPVILGDYMYVCSGASLTRFNMLTGEKGWAQNFTVAGIPSSFLTSTPLLADGKIFIQNENTYMYCIDPQSGQIIWRQGNFGTASFMQYLNGVVYFVSGGDGKLYAIDAANGTKLWAITSPDYAKNSGATFDRYVGLVPPQNGAKGKIVVTTGLNAYCYEAYK